MSSETANDYVVGLLAAAVFVYCVLFTWSILLLVFKCLGRKRVGFLSGSAFETTARAKEGCCSKSCGCLTPFRSRVIFMLSGAIFITFSVLFFVKGVTQLQDTASTVDDTAVVSVVLLCESLPTAGNFTNQSIRGVNDKNSHSTPEIWHPNLIPLWPISLRSDNEGFKTQTI